MHEVAYERRVIFRQGKLVDLVILERSDISSFLRWFNDSEVTQYLLRQEPMLKEQEEEWFDNLPKRMPTDPVFGITTKDGKLIGNVGLHKIDHRHGTAILGAVIGEKDYWGKGYGSEAECLMVKYGFIDLNLRKITANIFSTNPRSLKAVMKVVAVEEGRRKAQFIFQGQEVDEIWIAIFRETFFKIQREKDESDLQRPHYGGH